MEDDALFYKPTYMTFCRFIYISTGVYFLFVLLNLWRDNYAYAVVAGFICIMNVVLFFNLKKILTSKYKDLIVFIYTCLLLASIALNLLYVGKEDVAYCWIFVVPFISYMLNRRCYANYATGFFIAMSVLAYFWQAYQYDIFDYFQFTNLLLIMLVMWFVAHDYQQLKSQVIMGVKDLLYLDPLTKLKNREQIYSAYYDYPDTTVALCLIDIRSIAAINSQHGYLAGDVVLINVAKTIMDSNIDKSLAFRIGDEQFAILFPNKSAEDCLITVRELFIELTNNKTVFKKNIVDAKISVSLTSIDSDGNNLDDLMYKGSTLLQQARESNTDKLAI